MAGKGSSGKSSGYGKHGVGHKSTGPTMAPVHRPHGPTGGGRAGNTKPQSAKSSAGASGE